MTPDALRAFVTRCGLPDGLGWAVSPSLADHTLLAPDEAQAVARAVPSRRAEFTGGRVAARAAMQAVGMTPAPIPMHSDRAPLWPTGCTGSITHMEGLCLAIVGRSETWRGIGVDLEADAALGADLIPVIATPPEIARHPSLTPGLVAARIFSAKEAAYKAQYPETRALFGFESMAADIPAGTMRMVADLGLGLGAVLPIRQWAGAGVILSLCARPNA